MLGIPAIAMKVPPLFFGLQDHRGLHHAHRRRISCGFRFPDLAEDALHFRKLRQELVLNLEVLRRLRHGDAGKRDRHVENRAFIQRGHEFRTQP